MEAICTNSFKVREKSFDKNICDASAMCFCPTVLQIMYLRSVRYEVQVLAKEFLLSFLFAQTKAVATCSLRLSFSCLGTQMLIFSV